MANCLISSLYLPRCPITTAITSSTTAITSSSALAMVSTNMVDQTISFLDELGKAIPQIFSIDFVLRPHPRFTKVSTKLIHLKVAEKHICLMQLCKPNTET